MAQKDFAKDIGFFSAGDVEKSEFETGFLIERRRVLWLPVIAAAALLSPRTFSAGVSDELLIDSLTWDEFLKQCLPRALELHKDSSARAQDAYLHWIASMAARLNLSTIPKAKLGRFKNVEPPAKFGVEYRGKPFFVVEWEMSPNLIFPPHNHPSASVCTVGIAGETRIRNFEVVGDPPEFTSDRQFRVRETNNQILSEGRINTLSMKRDNIHMFEVGPMGARGIDITTPHSKYTGFSFIDIQKKAIDAKKMIFEANWKKL